MEFDIEKINDFDKNNYEFFVLGCDIGGTNANFGILGVKGKDVDFLSRIRFKTKDIQNLHDAINQTLVYAKENYDIEIFKSCIAAAGPISADGKVCNPTNFSLEISVEKILANTALVFVTLINDFEAIGYGVNLLDKNNEKDLVPLPHTDSSLPQPIEKATASVVGAGTGLGKAILIWEKGRGYIPRPSEGGHVDFPIASEEEWKIIKFLKEKYNSETIGYETLVSGQGITNIYKYLRQNSKETEVTKQLDVADDKDKPSLIAENVDKDETCRKTYELFRRFYARAARNFALETMARGGVYLAGGIIAKDVELFKEQFMKEFEKNYRLKSVLKEIPVYVIVNYDVSILGAGNVAANFPEKAFQKEVPKTP